MREQPSSGGGSSGGAALAAWLATLGLAACAASGGAAVSTQESTAGASPSPAAASATGSATSTVKARPALPAGFPVMPGATAATLPNDPTLIARWTVNELGSAAYDFYVSALPAAGFPLVGLYPAERSALIRFGAAGGAVLQLVAEQVGSGTEITVQTDRP